MLRELLTMKNLLFAGIAATSMLMISPANAASDSAVSKAETGKSPSIGGIFDGRRGGGHTAGPQAGGNHTGVRGPGMGGNHRWGHRIGGRWFAGFQAPGGWNGYRTPFRGFALPTYWVQPVYRINNFPTYGLYAPQTGYGWSRYYDDAVLTDSRGYVYDHASNIPWDRYEGGYAPGDFPEPDFGPTLSPDQNVYRNDERALDNSRYAPPAPQVDYQRGTGQPDPRQMPYDQNDPRYAASGYRNGEGYQSRQGFEQYERCLQGRGVTGGAVGAVVGAVVGNRVAGRNNRTIGTVLGGIFGGAAGYSIEKVTKKCKKYLPRDDYYYYDHGGQQVQPQYAPPPPPAPQGYGHQQGGYYQNGWYYPAPTVTTITVMPAVVTSTVVTEEFYYETVAVPAKKRPASTWKPKPKKKHTCGCR